MYLFIVLVASLLWAELLTVFSHLPVPQLYLWLGLVEFADACQDLFVTSQEMCFRGKLLLKLKLFASPSFWASETVWLNPFNLMNFSDQACAPWTLFFLLSFVLGTSQPLILYLASSNFCSYCSLSYID